MARILKRSTQVDLLVGPFVLAADGSNYDASSFLSSAVLLNKHNTTSLSAKNDSTGCTLVSNGIYSTRLDVTDTNTLGYLTIVIQPTGCLPWRADYMVQLQNPYASFYDTSAYLDVNAYQVGGQTASATNLRYAASAMQLGTVYDDAGTYAGTTTVFYSDDIVTATADHWIGSVIKFTSGNLAKQGTVITDYELVAGTYGKFTVQALTAAPANNDTFIIV